MGDKHFGRKQLSAIVQRYMRRSWVVLGGARTSARICGVEICLLGQACGHLTSVPADAHMLLPLVWVQCDRAEARTTKSYLHNKFPS